MPGNGRWDLIRRLKVNVGAQPDRPVKAASSETKVITPETT